MTENQKNIVKSLVAVAWADGHVEDLEAGVVEGLLCGFDASEDEERELVAYARTRRTLKSDLPLGELDAPDRELVLANAALIVHADGNETAAENRVLRELSSMLGFSDDEARAILMTSVRP